MKAKNSSNNSGMCYLGDLGDIWVSMIDLESIEHDSVRSLKSQCYKHMPI